MREITITRQALALWAVCNSDLTVEKVTCYDEEGIEGWKWTYLQEDEYTETGSWSDVPEIPDSLATELLKIYQLSHPHQTIKLQE